MYTDLTHLKCEIKEQHQLWITLSQPERMNAISSEMIESLISVLHKADFDPQIRVIVIKGEGQAFSAGGDVKAMSEQSGMFAGDANELRMRYMHGIQKIPKVMEDISTPVIAMVNGAAVGAGCDLAMMCDLRIGSEKSKFGETFAALGLVPGDGGSFFLTRAVGFAKAMQMTLSADLWQGKAAFDFGLLHYYVSDSELEKATLELAQKICSRAPVALQMAKKALKISYLHDIHTSLDILAAYQGIAQRTQDHQQAVQAFIEKRTPQFTGK
ncbi:MAG: enoyl-CoA hydratase-related protein [Bdellovibrionia bacterium]